MGCDDGPVVLTPSTDDTAKTVNNAYVFSVRYKWVIRLRPRAMLAGKLYPFMAQRSHADDPRSDTEIKFYLPAGVGPSLVTRYYERLWALLSSQDGESSR